MTEPPIETSHFDTLVIGAGLSGLTAAYTLQQAGQRVLVLEAGTQAGGLIDTVTENGFMAEAGPNTFPGTAQELIALAQRLDLTPKPTSQQASKRYLYLNGHLTALPTKPFEAITTPVLSWGGKFRLLQEPFQPRIIADDISVADFVTRRLGPEVLHNLVDPFISGIYAGDVAALSLPAVFPKLWEWEQSGGSLFKGAQLAQKQARQAGKPKRAPMTLLSFEGGLKTLTNALAEALSPNSLLYGHAVIHLEPLSAGGYRVHTQAGARFECKHLILATPAFTTSRLLQSVSSIASRVLQEIPYSSITVVHLGFPQSAIPHALDGFGCLVPRRENLPLLGAIWASSLFPERAPEGNILLSCFIGGAHHPELINLSPEAIQQLVLDNLQTIFKTPTPLHPSFSRIMSYEKAIPQYTLGHRERIQTAESELQKTHPHITLCGNYLHGIALNECVKSGQAAAHRILNA